MRPPKVPPAIAPHRYPGQQSASLRHVPVPAPAAEKQNGVPSGLTRQEQSVGHEIELQTVVQALLAQTPALQVPHEVNPHLAASFPAPQAIPGVSHWASQQLFW